MSLTVVAPIPGTTVAMEDVPDPVFSGKFVGPGVAVDPGQVETITAKAPVDGTVAKIHPHAYVILSPTGRGVLVHLGLDTVQLAGQGFTVHVEEGQEVSSGDDMVTWSPQQITEGGRNPIVPVIVLEAEESDLSLPESGLSVNAGDELLSVK
ncbi:PTS sugar transporter subunit IIA [Actinomyces vulturis]|uniref:PTS sugar transporter subunit IIA n=1 Tax=Actinomyces vulturis TaxID=1857645 RepID=UPI0008327DC3|nr:PTS glucose transporter subunit IIA [Actinomyces vulturis]